MTNQRKQSESADKARSNPKNQPAIEPEEQYNPRPAGMNPKAFQNPQTLTPPQILQLQRTLGNRRVAGLLGRFSPAPAGMVQLVRKPKKDSKFADKKRRKFQIYAIRHKNSRKVAYVGQVVASRGYKRRFNEHIREKSWLNRKKYTITLLDSGNWTPFEACAFEQWYIDEYGSPLILENRIRALTRGAYTTYRPLHKKGYQGPYGWKPKK